MVLVSHKNQDAHLSVTSAGLHLATSPGSSPFETIDLASVAFILAPDPDSETPPDPSKDVQFIYLSGPPDSPALHTLDLGHKETNDFERHAFLDNNPLLDHLLLSTATPPRHIAFIINSSAGAAKAREFFDGVIRPLVECAGVTWEAHDTKGVDDAGAIGKKLVEEGKKTIAVLGGDGTVHELVNGVLLGDDGELRSPPPEVELILLPFGTANAYYFHLFPPESPSSPSTLPTSHLFSLLSYLCTSSSPLHPLPLALNTLPTSPHKILTLVVTSASLHASILHSSEALRATHPDLSRFKLAAEANVTHWTQGSLSLEGPGVERYDPAKAALVPVSGEVRTTLEGPFVYLTAALLSRLEATFVLAPLRTTAPSNPPTIDLVVMRPLRDPATRALVQEGKEEEAREGFVAKVWEVTKGAYSGGQHVGIVYPGGEGVVEYYRCGGFGWKPAPSEELRDRLVCLDGALRDLGTDGGELQTRVLGTAETGFKVWGR